jgi:hypothetical protein
MVIMRLGPVLLLAGVAGCRSSASPPIEIAPAVPDDHAVTAPIPGNVTASAGRIALDDARVYWVDAHANRGLETNAPSRLLSAPKAGGAPVELAATPTEASQGIAVDDAFAYVGYVGLNEPNPLACPAGRMCHEPPTIHGPTGAVLAVPEAGGAPRVLASGARDPVCVAADGRQVYWADGAALFRVPREGGRRTLLLANAGCRALALDATHVYCLGDGISRVPKAGGAGEVLVHGDAYEAALAVGPTAVYYDGLLDVRRSAPRTGCSCCGSQSAFCREPDPMIDSEEGKAVVLTGTSKFHANDPSVEVRCQERAGKALGLSAPVTYFRRSGFARPNIVDVEPLGGKCPPDLFVKLQRLIGIIVESTPPVTTEEVSRPRHTPHIGAVAAFRSPEADSLVGDEG